MADDSSEKKDEKGILGDTLKKVFTAGVTAAFMTEESVRAYLADIKLPKEVLNLLVQQASRSKDDITNRVSKEIVNMVQKMDFAKEFAKFAETHKFKISAEVEITKKDKSED